MRTQLSLMSGNFAAIAASIYEDYSKRKQRMPGIGHRTHAEGDPEWEIWPEPIPDASPSNIG